MVSRSRMPPPSCIGQLVADRARRCCVITASFFGLPAAAPFRSTRCRRRAPCASQCARHGGRVVGKHRGVVHVALLQAHAAPVLDVDRGDDQHGGLRAGCREGCSAPDERDQLDEGPSGLPVDEIRAAAASPAAWLFSGWNCTAKHVIARHRAGKGEAVVGVSAHQRRLARPRRSSCARNRSAIRRRCRPTADAARPGAPGSSPCAAP